MRALLDRDPEAVAPGDALPWGWHWLYFKPLEPQAELGEDGHPRRGRFLPGGQLGRRLWAGGELRFLEPLRLGDVIERVSTLKSVTAKEGRSGKLVFVTSGHRVSGPRGLACDEDQHLVYRSRPGDSVAPRGVPPEATPPEGEPEWEETFLPTSTALFRFSALTFNGHRIHYDHPYATEREGYRGLVVHGPLLALLLLDAGVRRTPERTAGVFTYRAVAPAFADEMITLVGQTESSGAGVRLQALNGDGSVVTKANLEWRP
jgi:3-methylfumaryl-CoA hydratase